MTYQTVKKLAPRDVGYLAGLIDGLLRPLGVAMARFVRSVGVGNCEF